MGGVRPVGVVQRRPGDQDFQEDSHQRDRILRIYLCPKTGEISLICISIIEE